MKEEEEGCDAWQLLLGCNVYARDAVTGKREEAARTAEYTRHKDAPEQVC